MIIISGCNGFIGKNLLKSIPNSVGISLRDREWRNSFSKANAIINLVGKAHDHLGTATREDYYYANVDLTKEIFKSFLDSDADLLIHISSIAAVEEFESITPLNEDAECKPISWYGESKRAAEIWLLEQELPDNKKLIILRPPMVHGPGDKGNLVLLYKFISKGIPYPFASFNNSRSFISIINFVYYIENILNKYMSLDSGIYHISDNEPLSTEEIIETIKIITKKKVIKFKVPIPLIQLMANIGDIIPIPINNKRLKKLTSTLLVSNSKINSRLKVRDLPETGIEGIKSTIKWFNNNH